MKNLIKILTILILWGNAFSQDENSIAYNVEQTIVKKQAKIAERKKDTFKIEEVVVNETKIEKETFEYVVPDFSLLTCIGDEFDSASIEKLTQIPSAGTIVTSKDTTMKVFVVIIDSSFKINSSDFNVGLNKGKLISVPQFISPNKDNINDTWEIANLTSYSENRIKLYDKYGKKILDLKNYKGGWDGVSNVLVNSKCQNVIVPDGKYFYSIQLNNEKKGLLYGCLTIRR